MTAKLKLAVDNERERTQVCGIIFSRDDEHEARCLMAWKRREHPQWSQHAVSYRVAEGPKLRRVV